METISESRQDACAHTWGPDTWKQPWRRFQIVSDPRQVQGHPGSQTETAGTEAWCRKRRDHRGTCATPAMRSGCACNCGVRLADQRSYSRAGRLRLGGNQMRRDHTAARRHSRPLGSQHRQPCSRLTRWYTRALDVGHSQHNRSRARTHWSVHQGLHRHRWEHQRARGRGCDGMCLSKATAPTAARPHRERWRGQEQGAASLVGVPGTDPSIKRVPVAYYSTGTVRYWRYIRPLVQ